MASPSSRGTADNGTGTGTGFTPTEVAGSTTNDIEVISIALEAGFSAFNAPAGWTVEYQIDATAYSFIVCSIRRGAGAPALNFSWTGSKYYDYHLSAWQGCVTTGAYVESKAQQTPTTATVAGPPAVTTASADTTVLALFSHWAGFDAATGAPAGYTKVGAQHLYDEWQCSKVVATSGTNENPGTIASNINTNDRTVSVSLVLASVAAGSALATLSPADNATNVSLLPFPAVLTFLENIQAGTGNIVLKDDTAGSTLETIAIGSCTISTITVKVPFTSTLTYGHAYHIEVASGAIQLASDSSPYAGFTDSTTWNFRALESPNVTTPVTAASMSRF